MSVCGCAPMCKCFEVDVWVWASAQEQCVCGCGHGMGTYAEMSLAALEQALKGAWEETPKTHCAWALVRVAQENTPKACMYRGTCRTCGGIGRVRKGRTARRNEDG
eukprot:449058-Pelagomonas_calceolata.AAC.4